MGTTSSPGEGQINLISKLNPPALERAWFSATHPRLPWVATCASDKTVRIYSLTSFTQLSVISGGHKRSVRTCAWKPGLQTESILATGSFDTSVGVWRHEDDSSEGRAMRELDFTDAGVNGDNQDEDEDEEWRFALVLDGHDSEVKSVSWSAGGNFLATCSRDKSVWIWEEVGDDDYETIAVLQEHTADVKCVAWHPEEELLASGSYDDDIRLWREDIDDWGCVGLLRGHSSTVWGLDWEGLDIPASLRDTASESSGRGEWLQRRTASGSRLMSCSDDRSIRVWRRQPKERTLQNALSSIRTDNNMEEWVEEATLPRAHECPIYAVAWNKRTGLAASCGGDGRIVVYAERWASGKDSEQNTSQQIDGGSSGVEQKVPDGSVKVGLDETEWVIVADLEAAHDVFEVNHVTWGLRADKGKGDQTDEEVIISTGDDGVVKVWSLNI